MHLVPNSQKRPTEDPIFAVNAEANARKAAGHSVVNATIGVAMDDAGKLSVLGAVATALAETKVEHWSAYAPIAGATSFLDGVRNDLLSTVPALRDCAIATATPGGSGALRLAISNYLEPGQALLTTSYYWGPYQTLAEESQRKVDTFAMFDAAGAFNIAALEAAVEKHIAAQGRVLLAINDPCQNPTGYTMKLSDWRSVVEVLVKYAEKAPITLLCDMAYMAYAASEPRVFLTELLPLLGRCGLVFAWSASKTFTMYGLRVGALVACVADAQERKMTDAAFAYSCRGTWSNCNHGGMQAIARLLNDDALRAKVNSERDVVKAMLQERVRIFNELARPQGLEYPPYDGGFFVTLFAKDSFDRANKMKADGVFVYPQTGTMRVALCSVAKEDVPRLVQSLVSSK
jgi:aromatic-amino-acid transaminase